MCSRVASPFSLSPKKTASQTLNGGTDSDASGDHQTVRTARTGRTGMTEGPRTKAQRKPAEANKRLPASRPGGDPVDLLDRQATRQLAGASKPRRQQDADDGIEFETNASGKMIIKVGGVKEGRGRGVQLPCPAWGALQT
jgi:hypothetical protein